MPKFILLFLLVFSFGCTDSKEDFDTSPFGDKDLLPSAPIGDLIDAVIVFQKKYNEVPTDLSSLKRLSRKDYIDACITDGISDSIIVDESKLKFFSESETSFQKVPSGFEVQFTFKDSSQTFFAEWMESLYSTDFDGYTFMRFDVFVEIDKGNGSMIIDLESNKTELFIEEIVGSYGLNTPQEFHLLSEQIIIENPEPLCFEE